MTVATERRELNMEKRIHRFSHANAKDMELLMRPAGFDKQRTKDACETVQKACAICTTCARPPDRKISSTHVNETFNEEIQAEFM